MNNNDMCFRWAMEGWCFRSTWMRENCKRTCNVCDEGGEDQQVENVDTGEENGKNINSNRSVFTFNNVF